MGEVSYIQKSFVINFRGEQGTALRDNLARYIELTGYTQLRFFLMGVATLIDHNGDNPELVMEIADFIGRQRYAGAGTRKTVAAPPEPQDQPENPGHAPAAPVSH